MWYSGVRPQRRLTVGFRLVLAIPQFIVVALLFIALFAVAVIGWFGALFTGRLPDWAHAFISGVTRWNTRVSAYVFLLTDEYPPFALEDEDYPARPFPPENGRLNRWAVFFRVILAIPASAFAQIVNYGLTIPLLFVTWFIVLIRGEMPPSLYGCYSALLRYQFRFLSYFYLLTSEYPWGMLGDRDAFASVPPGPYSAPPPSAAPPPYGLPGSPPPPPTPTPTPPASTPAPAPQPYAYPSGQQPSAPPPPDEATPAPGVEPVPGPGPGDAGPGSPGWPPPLSSPLPPPSGYAAMPPPPPPWQRAAPPPGQGPSWAKLALTGAARSWMIFAIVWGSAVFVAQSVVQRTVINNNNANNNTNPYPIDLPAPVAHHAPFD
jgi:hypothetical protein